MRKHVYAVLGPETKPKKKKKPPPLNREQVDEIKYYTLDAPLHKRRTLHWFVKKYKVHRGIVVKAQKGEYDVELNRLEKNKSYKREKNFKESVVIPFLKKLENCTYFVNNDPVKTGVPDIFICLNGHFCSLELKRDEDEAQKKTGTRNLQIWNNKKIRKANGYARTVDPEKWPEIRDNLKALSKETNDDNLSKNDRKKLQVGLEQNWGG